MNYLMLVVIVSTLAMRPLASDRESKVAPPSTTAAEDRHEPTKFELPAQIDSFRRESVNHQQTGSRHAIDVFYYEPGHEYPQFAVAIHDKFDSELAVHVTSYKKKFSDKALYAEVKLITEESKAVIYQDDRHAGYFLMMEYQDLLSSKHTKVRATHCFFEIGEFVVHIFGIYPVDDNRREGGFATFLAGLRVEIAK